MIVTLLWALPALAASDPVLLCESEQGPAQPAKVVVKAAADHWLFACGTAHKAKGDPELSSFKVFALSKAGKKSEVFKSPGLTTYRLVKSGESLSLRELIPLGKERFPAFEVVVSCEGRSCKAAAQVCAYEPPAKVDAKALKDVRRYVSGNRKGKVPPVRLIHRLAGLAYAGDSEALELFEDRGPLRLDGPSADAYFDHAAALERLKKAGCLSKGEAAPKR